MNAVDPGWEPAGVLNVRRVRSFERLRNVLLVALLMFGTRDAAAQEPRAEVFGGAGVSRVGGDDGSLGTGLSIVGGIGYPIAMPLSVEVSAMSAWHSRSIAGGPLEGTVVGIFGSVTYDFGEARTRMFVLGSVGILHSSRTHTLPSPDAHPTVRVSDVTDFAWGGGSGVRIFLRPQLSLRAQFRMVWAESTGVMGLPTGSLALGYQW